MWRAYSGVIHCVLDQHEPTKLLYLPKQKPIVGEGASDRLTTAAKYLYWSILRKADI
jgi:hypothetical protein